MTVRYRARLPHGLTVCQSATMLFACLTLSGCGRSPVAADPRIPPTTGAPDRLMIIDWNFGISATTCRAEATWGFLYSTSRDVTSEAAWESSASQVAAIVGPGRIVSVSPGDAEVRATFRGLKTTYLFRVFQGEPPMPVLEPRNTTYVSGAVRDDTLSFPSNGIEDATVEVISGHNAGIKTFSQRGGYYYFYPPFICGPITARATKSGYRETVASSVMCMSGMPELRMTRE